jgi:integrase
VATEAHAGLRLHDLRHSYASAALAAGEHPKVVQERLVHSSTKITLDIYSHVTKELGDEAADRIARSILGGEQ